MRNMILWTIILTTFWSCGKKVVDFKATPETLTESIPLTSPDVNSHVFEGNSAPNATLGEDLDLFINKTNQEVYFKRSSQWELVYTFPDKTLKEITPVVDIHNVDKGLDKAIYLDLKTSNIYFWSGKDLELLYDASTAPGGNPDLNEDSDDNQSGTSSTVVIQKTRFHIPAVSKDFAESSVKKMILPYLEKNEENKKTLDTLFNNETNLSVGSKRTVKNAQVFFEFDLKGVEKNQGKLVGASLALNIKKYHLDDKNNTEIVCLLNMMNCSGTVFTNDSGFYKLLNLNFFNRKTQAMNSVFSNRISEKADWDREENTSTLSENFQLSELFGVDHVAVSQVIEESKTKKLSFVVADDIQLLDSPILILEFEKK